MRPLRIMATITAGQLCTGWVRAQARANKEQSTLRYQVEAAHKARNNIDKVGPVSACSCHVIWLYARCMRGWNSRFAFLYRSAPCWPA